MVCFACEVLILLLSIDIELYLHYPRTVGCHWLDGRSLAVRNRTYYDRDEWKAELAVIWSMHRPNLSDMML